jgi:ribosomal protein S18 acetylase RimI-like enzyme
MIDYRDARPKDGPALGEMAARCFVETFGPFYKAEDMEAFIASAFGPDGLPAQIGTPGLSIRLAVDDDQIAGFAKLGPSTLPPAPEGSAELKQLYVLKPWHGGGVAATLMDWAIATSRERGASHLSLSVWVDNHRAQRFYARYGMEPIGFHPFTVGDHIDNDPVWSMKL